eukprot:2628227-Pleurochrysis_carterae.AAC.6
MVAHYSLWLTALAHATDTSVGQATRLVSVSQPHAGAFFYALPTQPCMRMTSSEMHVTLQRRLGLHIPALLSSLAGDTFGDVAVNRESLSTRQSHVSHAWFSAIGAVHGIAAMKEPAAAIHSSYSTGA